MGAKFLRFFLYFIMAHITDIPFLCNKAIFKVRGMRGVACNTFSFRHRSVRNRIFQIIFFVTFVAKHSACIFQPLLLFGGMGVVTIGTIVLSQSRMNIFLLMFFFLFFMTAIA